MFVSEEKWGHEPEGVMWGLREIFLFEKKNIDIPKKRPKLNIVMGSFQSYTQNSLAKFDK